MPLGPRLGIDARTRSPAARTPADSLCAVIHDHTVGHDTVVVEFSGGCDSSLVLAAATRVRRAAGLPDPVPLTYRFSGVPEAEESTEQELMVRHLGLREWVRLDRSHTFDLLGAQATDSLRTHGLLWPATVHPRGAVLRQLPPGSVLLSGEGGDESLGARRVRWLAEAVRHVVRGRHLPPGHVLGPAARSLLPVPLRRRALEREIDDLYAPDWLDQDLRTDLIGQAAALDAAEPLRPSQWADHHLSSPRVALGMAMLRSYAAAHAIRYEAPLLDRTFMDACTAAIAWHEYRGRTFVLRHHFGDLLPPEIVERTTKATFNRSYFGPSAREFAERWTGAGVPEGVDENWLRRHWIEADVIHGGTAMLLHHAWLADEGLL